MDEQELILIATQIRKLGFKYNLYTSKSGKTYAKHLTPFSLPNIQPYIIKTQNLNNTQLKAIQKIMELQTTIDKSKEIVDKMLVSCAREFNYFDNG